MQGAKHPQQQRQAKGAYIGKATQQQGVLVHGPKHRGDGLLILKGNAPIAVKGVL